MDPPASAHRRNSQVFVEIPYSPLCAPKPGKGDRGHQEATPLKAVALNNHPTPTPSSSNLHLKRKSPEGPQDIFRMNTNAQQLKSKKPKTEGVSTVKDNIQNIKDNAGGDPSANPVRCHQCSRQYDHHGVAQCTFKRPAGTRCVLKYCKACLRNRYKEDILRVKARTVEDCSEADRAQHILDEEYIFQCPRCRDACDCRICRKQKGLPAAGNLNQRSTKQTVTKETVGQDAKIKTKQTPTVAGVAATSGKKPPKPTLQIKNVSATNEPISGKSHISKPKPHVLVPPSPYKTTAMKAPTVTKPRGPKPKPAPAFRPIPKVKWAAVSTSLTYDGAVERMNIREFLLRFAHLAKIARSHLEELEDLVKLDAYIVAANDTTDDSDDARLVGWISETALRAILIGLLTFLSNDDDVSNRAAAIASGIQQIRNSGANLTKMWTALDTLRGKTSLAIPDALPPPASAANRTTRRSQGASDAPSVVSTAQLLPAVAALIESALHTKAVREDYECAATQEKDLSRAARELAAAENSRWRDIKATDLSSTADKASKAKLNAQDSKDASAKADRVEKKAAKAAHEAAIASFDHAHALAVTECMARFGPLGRDTEGRVYYALTPGVIEREAALEMLEGGRGEVKFGRRRNVIEEGERREMLHWSWFIAVWGRKPDNADVFKPSDVDDEEDDDAERWWGFWEPKEIALLAEWLAMKHGIDLDAKRPLRSAEDSTVLNVGGADERKRDDKKSRGRTSNASSIASTSRARTFASMNADSDSEELPEDGDLDTSNADGDVQMRLDDRGEPVPTKADLWALARGLKDYSGLLEWRINRATKHGKEIDDKEEGRNSIGKGKAAAKSVQAIKEIPPTRFYGK